MGNKNKFKFHSMALTSYIHLCTNTNQNLGVFGYVNFWCLSRHTGFKNYKKKVKLFKIK